MPPTPTWYRGREAIREFLALRPLAATSRRRLAPTRANGQPAFAQYVWDAELELFALHGIIVLTVEHAQIAEITAFLEPRAFAPFGLG